jgi:putative addiction module component (TIGR02574 family)
MASPVPNPPPGFDELSVEQKVEYVESLWDAILDSGADVPVPEWHREVLDERLEQFRKNPDSGIPWEDVRDELRRKYPSRS